ncbi:MAG: hydroxyacid-oxoacid transhydrogenase [Thermodesulfobacteriota bacterium]
MPNEIAFEMAAGNRMRFGKGATREIGMDLADMKVRRVMVLTDAYLASQPPVAEVRQSLEDNQVPYVFFDRVRIEPNDASFLDAIEVAKQEEVDAFVAVGGGSTMDTAKAANLYSTYPGDFLDYFAPPVGKGRQVPGPCKPLIAVPTTAGTGSEHTGIAVVDIETLHVKAAFVHQYTKPVLGIVDPENTKTLPPMVAAATGLDVLSHVFESYTAIPYTQRPRPERPSLRPPYQGSNPISDIWCLDTLRTVAKYLIRAIEDPEDEEARSHMLLASSCAGVAFETAGVAMPHGLSYPIAGMVRQYRPEGYPPGDHPLAPHGIAVILTAPAVARFTAPACPERHLQVAEILGASVSQAKGEDAGKILADEIVALIRRLKLPNGIAAVGFTREDIPQMVKGALRQQRNLHNAPRFPSEDDLAQIYEESLVLW